MNVNAQGLNLFSGFGLKSTQERMDRQAKRDNQIVFFEKQKENLKNMKTDSLEDISRKLEMLHGYDDQIAAAKQEYNHSQMFHTMDEAREKGEKIAEAAEKNAPKTEEERREELIEEATGVELPDGILAEVMEELEEVTEEMTENMEEEIEAAEDLTEEALSADESLESAVSSDQTNDFTGEAIVPDKYKRIDLRI